jgi:hypothetical protein
MKRTKNLLPFLLLALLATSSVIAKTTYTNWWGIEYVKNERESLRDYVQNCCSSLMGKMFARYETNDRNALYDRIVDEILQTNFYGQNQLKKNYVDAIVHKWLIDFTGRKAQQCAFENGFSHTLSQLIKVKMKERVAAKVHWSVQYTQDKKYGLSKGFFEQFLGDYNITQQVGSIKREEERSKYWSELIGGAWNLLFEYTEHEEARPPTPTPEYQVPIDFYQPEPSAPPAVEYHPTPSAPPYQPIVVTNLYTTDECAANCFTNFKEDGENRIFLPCGHNYCKDCLENWIFVQGKNSCPQCRAEISHSEKAHLRTILDDQYSYCAGCNNYDESLRTLTCHHKLCNHCERAWADAHNKFRHECPRCSYTFQYLG